MRLSVLFHSIAVKQPWKIWENLSSPNNKKKTQHSFKQYAYFLGWTVPTALVIIAHSVPTLSSEDISQNKTSNNKEKLTVAPFTNMV